MLLRSLPTFMPIGEHQLGYLSQVGGREPTHIFPCLYPMISLLYLYLSIYLSMYHSVSLENAANYDKDRHLRANFNDVSTKTKSFLSRLQSAWPGKKFQEIILDCKIGTLLLYLLFIWSIKNMVKMLLANISTYISLYASLLFPDFWSPSS